jgi:peptide deformylase
MPGAILALGQNRVQCSLAATLPRSSRALRHLSITKQGKSQGGHQPLPLLIILFPIPPRRLFAETPLALEIIHYPHPTLRHPSKPLKRVDSELRRYVAEMFDLMYEHEGVGLAANQVDLPYRLFVANPEGDSAAKDAECVFINPVLSAGRGQEEDEEGCLSIPGVHAPVTRNSRIKVQAYDLAGNEVVAEVEGLMARIVQHETDHLDGTLFIDRLGPAQLTALRDKLEEFELVFQSRRDTGEIATPEQLAARILDLERLRT